VIISANNSLTFASCDELQKMEFNKSYHLASNMLPHYLADLNLYKDLKEVVSFILASSAVHLRMQQ